MMFDVARDVSQPPERTPPPPPCPEDVEPMRYRLRVMPVFFFFFFFFFFRYTVVYVTSMPALMPKPCRCYDMLHCLFLHDAVHVPMPPPNAILFAVAPLLPSPAVRLCSVRLSLPTAMIGAAEEALQAEQCGRGEIARGMQRRQARSQPVKGAVLSEFMFARLSRGGKRQ